MRLSVPTVMKPQFLREIAHEKRDVLTLVQFAALLHAADLLELPTARTAFALGTILGSILTLVLVGVFG